MPALGKKGSAVEELKVDLGAHALCERLKHAARERDPAVAKAELASGGDAVDPPGPLADHFGLGRDTERKVFEIGPKRVRDR